MIKITIEGIPIAKSRHRCRCINGYPSAYDDQSQKVMPIIRAQMQNAWNSLLQSKNPEIKLEVSRIELEPSLIVGYTFMLPVADSACKGQKNAKLWGFIHPNQKPDYDNLIKFYSDCANKVLWSDDKIITHGWWSKQFSEKPRTEIQIMTKHKFNMQKDVEEIFKIFSPSQLKEFSDDCKQITNFFEDEKFKKFSEDCTKMDREHFFHASSMLLINFSNKHCEMIKKISKIGNNLDQNSFIGKITC